jgi:predicted O-methyltransferase YrrM
MFQHTMEITALGELLIREGVKTVLEIGGHRGGTAAFFGTLASELVVTVDLPDGRWGGIGEEAAARRDIDLVKLIPHHVAVDGDSHDGDTIARVQAVTPPNGFDFVFIDGDHSLLGVAADLSNYGKLARRGGLIGFHDITDTEIHRRDGVEVHLLWRDLAAKHEHWVFDDKQAWGGIGVVRA